MGAQITAVLLSSVFGLVGVLVGTGLTLRYQMKREKRQEVISHATEMRDAYAKFFAYVSNLCQINLEVAMQVGFGISADEVRQLQLRQMQAAREIDIQASRIGLLDPDLARTRLVDELRITDMENLDRLKGKSPDERGKEMLRLRAEFDARLLRLRTEVREYFLSLHPET